MAHTMPKAEDKILCVADLRRAASKKLSTTAEEFYNDGATGQVTVVENSTAYRKYRLRPRVLRDVSKTDPSVTVLGQKIDFPCCVAPAGIQAMAHPDGELATSRACAQRNVHMGVSSFANHSVEDIRAASQAISPIGHVMQLYSMQDRSMQERIVQRAERAGCKAIFLTADSPVLGIRYNEHRHDFRTPQGLEFPMLEMTSDTIRSKSHDEGFVGFNSNRHSWEEEIPYLRSITNMQIWIKGVLTAEDVLLAVRHKCDGVIVSNHGGRQLDETPATIDALPECVEAAAGRIPVHIDGGIRSGVDVFKALALGAECCWVGRPAIWGLAYDGGGGVKTMLDLIHAEFLHCMQLTGCVSVSDINKSSLGLYRTNGPLARL